MTKNRRVEIHVRYQSGKGITPSQIYKQVEDEGINIEGRDKPLPDSFLMGALVGFLDSGMSVCPPSKGASALVGLWSRIYFEPVSRAKSGPANANYYPIRPAGGTGKSRQSTFFAVRPSSSGTLPTSS